MRLRGAPRSLESERVVMGYRQVRGKAQLLWGGEGGTDCCHGGVDARGGPREVRRGFVVLQLNAQLGLLR